ncbi:DUF3179 domain-containing protein [Leisingera sp. ANG-Vp]|uniref:DUF3179 domain-containing protein n=1 Tax=Leisingera sp. ANG-Vp TaxID=1577896 RepID=UPI00057E3780|nr:DUF3179 domain-containing protein [Leisingera sp. ANG-Vp]KIC22625.1 hypothetical protein RA20_01800 [Leisingera sp. ANG-Vp]
MLKRLLLSAAVLLPWPVLAGPADWKREWPKTDFSQSLITDWQQIRSGGVPKDGIPALDRPQFLEAGKDRRLKPREPVITLEIEGAAPRAYPLRYLTWHEIVNDEVAGVPVAVTYCPLCNSAVTFDRRTKAGVLSFGVTGKLRYSDMVMYDRETQSWWQQALGTGIVGEMSGQRLASLPSWVESWEEFTARNPDGLVMAQPGYNRSYGRNPYRGYDTSDWPFLYDGAPPPHGLSPLDRVVRVGSRAWPLTRLAREGEIREAGLMLSWRAGQASALDSRTLAGGRDIGSVRVRDQAGLDVPHDVMFAFAFHAFWPDGNWMLK